MDVQRKLYVCYVDYKKAFDLINHKKLIEIFKAYYNHKKPTLEL